ncbi:glycosyl transferase 2 family protein, partial [Streptococcus pyogenes]
LLQEEDKYSYGMLDVEWDRILSNAVKNIYNYSSEEHSVHLLPFYLLRIYNYLKYSKLKDSN